MTPAITHLVDMIEGENGAVDEEYNCPAYAFGPASTAIARAYMSTRFIRSFSNSGAPTPEMMAYLQQRFPRIDRLERRGYEQIRSV